MVGAWAEAAAGGMRGDRPMSRKKMRSPDGSKKSVPSIPSISGLSPGCLRAGKAGATRRENIPEPEGASPRFSQAAASIAIAGAAPGTAAFSASPCVIEAGLARERPKCNKASVASLFNIFNILYVARNSWPRVGGRNGQNFYIDTFARGRG